MEHTITKRSIAANTGFKSLLSQSYLWEDFDRKILELETAKESKDFSAVKSRILPELYRMLAGCNISFEKDKYIDYYKKLIQEKISGEKYGIDELSSKILAYLYDTYRAYATPEEYMERLVKNLRKEEDGGWKKDSVRLQILKQFIKYGDYLKDGGYSGRTKIQGHIMEKTGRNRAEQTAEFVVKNLKDDIFDCLEGQNLDDYKLIKLADDLAKGKFRTNGATKKGLYYFAVVYDMKYYPDKEVENYDKWKDIEKNLFQDYYHDNLMRYLSSDFVQNLPNYEVVPSGQGINYKNFAEAIFLYYLMQNISASEKIKKANEMIQRVKNKTCPEEKANNISSETSIFKEYLINGQIIKRGKPKKLWDMSELDAESFIICHYNTSCPRHLGPFQVEQTQNTAYQKYCKILESINNLQDWNYGLWFVDIVAFRKNPDAGFREKITFDQVKFDNFMQILKGINHVLGFSVEEKESSASLEQEHKEPLKRIINTLAVNDSAKMSRTAIMVAFYYCFNIFKEEEWQWDNFEAFYEDYVSQVNEYLTECGYQEISEKNIFDMYVIYSAFMRFRS